MGKPAPMAMQIKIISMKSSSKKDRHLTTQAQLLQINKSFLKNYKNYNNSNSK